MGTKTDETVKKINKFLADRDIIFDYTAHGFKLDDIVQSNGKRWEYQAFNVRFDRHDGVITKVLRSPWRQGIGITEDPTPTPVLYSLLLDRVNGQTLEEWAHEFGYDTDSRRAGKVYQACLESEKQLNAFFSESEIEELEKILENY